MKTSFPLIFLSCATQDTEHLPGEELPSNVHAVHCTRVSAISGCCFCEASCLIETSCKLLWFNSQKVSLVSMRSQLDVFRFPHMGLLWHGHWRWNRPPSAHKHATTLPALCTAGRDDTRGTGLYWVLLRLQCKSMQCSGNAQPAGQQWRVSGWNTGRLANVESFCRPVCCVCGCCEMGYNHPSAPSLLKSTTPSFNPNVLFGV